jgi:hypothetical protein
MRKVFLVLLIFAGTMFKIDAQDLITKKNGDEIRAKVIEIDSDVIKYKLYDNREGPTYVLPKSEIFRIKYESGRIEVFDTTQSATGTTTTQSSTGTATQSSTRTPPPLKTFGAGATGTTTTTPTSSSTTNITTPPEQSRTPVTQYTYQTDWKAKMQAAAPDLYQKYRKGATMTGVGIGLLSAGVVAVVVGVATGEKSTTKTATSVSYRVEGTGGAVAAIGSVCVLTGTTLMIIGSSKKRKIKQQYFTQYGNKINAYERKSPLQSPHLELRLNGLAFMF